MANLKITQLPAANTPILSGVKFEAVQDGINVQVDADDMPGSSGSGVTSVNGDSGPAVLLSASNIPFTPAGGITSADVQSAIQELDTDVDDRISAAIAGIKWKTSVRVATTVAGTLASDFENGDTVDGVVLATGNRILIKNQVDQTTNGIYTVNASGLPTRSTDADVSDELESAAVTVDEGTSNANTTWLQITDSINLGVSDIVWTQYGSSVPDADATTKGIVELATPAEVITGTDSSRAVTPEGYSQARMLGLAFSDELTPITAATTKLTFHFPYTTTIQEIWIELKTAQASGNIFTVDVNKSGTTILSTKLTIDNTEETSLTATTPPVISVASVTKGDKITIDVDQVGNGTAIGGKIWFRG